MLIIFLLYLKIKKVSSIQTKRKHFILVRIMQNIQNSEKKMLK